MAVHPLFDENVVACFPRFSDALIAATPDDVHAVDAILRPDNPVRVEVTFPDSPRAWTAPEPVLAAARDFCAAWVATGQPMPAFQFTHRKDETGEWTVSSALMTEW